MAKLFTSKNNYRVYNFYCCTVWYAPKLGDLGLKVSAMKKREDVWIELKSLPMEKMDYPLPWYPETSGYEVCTIKNGKYHLEMFRRYCINCHFRPF